MTRVLHVLDHSLPEQSGYAYRSHSILRELANRGVAIAAITSPKQCRAAGFDEVDGIRYRRTPTEAPTGGIVGQVRTIRLTRAHVASYLREQGAEIIHAHSPCLNALAGLGHGRPLLYEMRSSWEDAAVSSGSTTEGSLRYRLSRMLETTAARRADEIVVICEGLKRDLVARGIEEQKITVVPNAVPPEMFERAAAEQGAAIRARFGLTDNAVIGFFGSFFEWEGLSSLIHALPKVVAAVPAAKLLLAGGGLEEGTLRTLVERLALGDRVVFAGRIGHDEVRAFYGAADVMAYPRTPQRLTEMVTPLKPLEAMAQCTAVVASDVGGHRELIEDDETGFLFRAGDTDALAERLVYVLGRPEILPRVVANARAKVERERRWSVVAERYLPIYARLVNGRAIAAAERVLP